MSTNIPAPDSFNFKTPEEWDRWHTRFERYLRTAKIEEGEDKVNTMIYCMGIEAEDILTGLQLSSTELKNYDTVKEKFKWHFAGKKNLIFERVKFSNRIQGEDEPAENFIRDLWIQVEKCDYGNLKEDLLRDRIVAGIKDKKLSEQMQTEQNLTLQNAIDKVKTREAVQKQAAQLNSFSSSNVNSVQHKRYGDKRSHSSGKNFSSDRRHKHTQHSHQSSQHRQSSASSSNSCFWCGKQRHSKEHCPAKNSICKYCKKKGHWEVVCRNKKRNVHEVETSPELNSVYCSDEQFLGMVQSTKDDADRWTINLHMNQHPVKCKIDTGADVSVISCELYKNIANEISLEPPDKVLIGANSGPLDVIGKLSVKCVTQTNKSCFENFYVVKKLKTPLLGRPAIEKLNLVNVADTITSNDLKQIVRTKFPKLFTGLGLIKDFEYKIQIRENATPFAITTPRRVAHPLLPKVEKELNKMVEQGVIRKLESNETSQWCAGLVVVPKAESEDVRLCVDLTKLNQYIVRPRYLLPTVESTLAKLKDAKIFTKLDANSSFYQIKLAKESQILTQFLTPFGRFCFTRLPFGITSGSEVFQERINSILCNMPNVNCQIDDILVDSADINSHENVLFPVLQKLQDSGITLNPNKCEFLKSEVSYVGHKINEMGILPDDKKIKAITNMLPPTCVSEMRCFLGMANQLGRFIPDMAEMTQPLRDLLKKNNAWVWDKPQIDAFEKVKSELSSPRVLKKYNPKHETRSMTDCEKLYSQMEKEALALTWACERFSEYILGMHFTLVTDHENLVSSIMKKTLDEVTPRITRFKIRLMRYKFVLINIPGKEMYTADTLSRAPLPDTECTKSRLEEEAESFIRFVIEQYPLTERKLDQIKQHQHEDEICAKIMLYTQEGWPDKSSVPSVLIPYMQFLGSYSIHDGLLLKDHRIVIPSGMRLEILDRIHEGHLGITKCRERAISSVWWIGLSKQIEEVVNNCMKCVELRSQTVEPLKPTPLPDRPWQKVACDLCELQGKTYLVLVDYYSRYLEFALLDKGQGANIIVTHLKSIFARHGIPEVLVSDNGGQFHNSDMAKFSAEYNFTHLTSSPKHSSGNGAAEIAVNTFKNLLKKNKDPYIALLNYRATPIHNGYSPAELSMGRRLRTTLPIAPHLLNPRSTPEDIQKKEAIYKDKMKFYHDKRHNAKPLNPLALGQPVLIRDNQKEGTVAERISQNDRSYKVSCPTNLSSQTNVKQNVFRRNRSALISLPAKNSEFNVSRKVQNNINDTKDGVSNSQFKCSESVQNSTTPMNNKLEVKNASSRNGNLKSDNFNGDIAKTVITRSGRLSRPPTKIDL